MSIFDDIRGLKSLNDLEGAWQVGWKALQNDKNNEFLKTSLFWVVYAALKAAMGPIELREKGEPRAVEKKAINMWASRISDLDLSLPSENVDFRLWKLFSKTGKFCEPICLYILKSGRKLFRPDEHKPFAAEKGESPSIVLKLARMVAACYLMSPQKCALPAARIVALINYAEDSAQDSAAGKVWLSYDKAKIYLQAGEIGRSRVAFLSVLQGKRSEPWAWFGLANTYADEPHIAIKLLSCGLSFAHDPKFSVPGLIEIAERFSEIGAYENASKSLSKLIEIYSQNGWAPKDTIVTLMSNSWYDASIDCSDFDSILRRLAEGAENYTVGKPQHYFGILKDVHASEKGANIYVSRDLTLSARKSMFLNRRFPEPGTPLKVLCDLSSDQQEVVSVEFGEHFDSQDIRFFHGILSVCEKGFGKVNGDIYVPSSLVSTLPDNSETKGVAVASFDKKKNRYGWKAITLRRNDYSVP